MPDKEEKPKSYADIIAEKLDDSVDTPLEVFLLFLFVVGFLSLASMTLVGTCGNVEDIQLFPDERETLFQAGGVVTFRNTVQVEDVIVGPGACGIIEYVEGSTAKVHVLAKQSLLDVPQQEYSPLSIVSYLNQDPFNTILFVLDNPPTGEVSLASITPIATRPFSNSIRLFYVSKMIWVFIALIIIAAVASYIALYYKNKREKWYAAHLLRTQYKELIYQEKMEIKNMRFQWLGFRDEIQEAEIVDITRLKEMVLFADDTTKRLMEIIGTFQGNSYSEQIQYASEKQIPTVFDLRKAHLLAISLRSAGDMETVLNTKELLQVITSYEEVLILFGLLEYSERMEKK